MRLWIESACQTSAGADAEASGDFVGTLTTEDIFSAIVTSGGHESLIPNTQYLFSNALSSLANGASPEAVTETLLASLPQALHVPISLLQVGPSSVAGRRSASLVECDAPPLFMARRGRLVLLPVSEEEAHGRLIRRCDFDLRDGDHLALVSEGYIHATGWDRRFGWRDIAVSIRRLTETRCDAEQLAEALVRSYQRFAASGVDKETRRQGNKGTDERDLIPNPQSPISVLALFVRPVRTATVWSGPPACPPSIPPATARGKERAMLDKLLSEEDMRIVCGDTTAEIAARLLGATLVLEPRPRDGWKEVPPTSKMIGPDGAEIVGLVTEGVVTMGVARDRLAEAKRPRDLTGRADGASRLAHLLLTADKVRFLVGLAVNPSQTERDGTPLRKVAVAGLAEDLDMRGKIVSIEYF